MIGEIDMNSAVFNTTSKNILLRDYLSEEPFAQKFEEFKWLADLSHFDNGSIKLSSKEHLNIRTYMLSESKDGQSSNLFALVYKKHPFLLYQQINKKEVLNEKMVNQDIYLLLVNDLLQDHYEHFKKLSNKRYPLDLYGVHLHTDLIKPESLRDDLDMSSSSYSLHSKIDIDTIVSKAISACSAYQYNLSKTSKYISDLVNSQSHSIQFKPSLKDLLEFVVNNRKYKLIFKNEKISSVHQRALKSESK